MEIQKRLVRKMFVDKKPEKGVNLIVLIFGNSDV